MRWRRPLILLRLNLRQTVVVPLSIVVIITVNGGGGGGVVLAQSQMKLFRTHHPNPIAPCTNFTLGLVANLSNYLFLAIDNYSTTYIVMDFYDFVHSLDTAQFDFILPNGWSLLNNSYCNHNLLIEQGF